MGEYVVKPDPEEDWYVYWSDVTDRPVSAGTRAEFLEASWVAARSVEPVARRLDRADRLGSSAFFDLYWWGCEWLCFDNRGMLPRARLRGFADAVLSGDLQRAYDMLEPFEDGMTVRRD